VHIFFKAGKINAGSGEKARVGARQVQSPDFAKQNDERCRENLDF
jgi:hypothetical protein